jgi:hypothetical protein
VSNVDERFLGHWQESRSRQQAMRSYLAKSSLGTERFEGRALDLIAEAFSSPVAGPPRSSTAARTAALLSDDR